MFLVLKVLYNLVLFGAEIGKREYFVVECIEVELMLEGHGGFVLLDIVIEQFLTGEGMLDDDDLCFGVFVAGEVAAGRETADQDVVFVSGGRLVLLGVIGAHVRYDQE